MPLEGVIERLEEASSDTEVRDILRAHRRAPGLCAAFFDRLLQTYAADPARTLRLASHWRLFLRWGDDPALAYRAKGAADRLSGKWLASARAFLRAGELAQDEEDRLAYAAGAIDGFAKAGKIDEAVGLGGRLAGGLRAMGEPPAYARVCLNTGNALLNAERNREARRWYRLAIPACAAHGLRTEEAAARLGLSTTHLFGGDPEVARAEAEASRTIARDLELDYLVALCDMNLAHVSLIQGRPDATLAILLEARARLEGCTSDLARLSEFLGDAYLRLNLYSEAADAYRDALKASDHLPALNRANVQLGLGEALSGVDPSSAERHLSRAEALHRRLGNAPWQSAAVVARATLTRPTLGPAADQRRAFRLATRALETAKGSPYHEVQALLAVAHARHARGLATEIHLRQASRRIRRYGFGAAAWRVHEIRARGSSTPLRHYRRMFAEILRARLAYTSVTARASFLRDKSEAIGRYLDALLARPTSARVREAVDVITRTRSATLIDEILSSDALRLTSDQTRQIEDLREELAREAAAEPRPADARHTRLPSVPLDGTQRRWIETTHAVGVLDAFERDGSVGECVVLSETAGTLRALVGDRAIELPMSRRELDNALRWLQFELLAPLAERDAAPDEAWGLLQELADGLVRPWWRPGGDSVRISPDASLWRVPWDALLSAIGDSRPATLCLHPSLSGEGQVSTSLQKVVVWVDQPADLPHAKLELDAFLRQFPTATVCRTRAEIVPTLEEAWDLVHVIGHARHNAGNPMFSCMRFPDGPVYAMEIARSPLRAKLVCLSACETGALSLAMREEPEGLVRAFLARGAQAVLASLWPLDDKAAERFFGDFYHSLSRGADIKRAIAVSRCSVREWQAHPYFWASLTLFGGYRQ